MDEQKWLYRKKAIKKWLFKSSAYLKLLVDPKVKDFRFK